MTYATDKQITPSMVFRDLVERTNPDTEAYLLGGMTPPIKQPEKWRCPLWREKTVGDWS